MYVVPVIEQYMALAQEAYGTIGRCLIGSNHGGSCATSGKLTLLMADRVTASTVLVAS
jgi:hypothetical protein